MEQSTSYNLRSKTTAQETTVSAMPGQHPNPSTPDAAAAARSGKSPQRGSAHEAEGEITLADIMCSVKQSEDKVCAKLDQVKEELNVITKKVSDLERAVSDNASRVLEIENEKMPHLESKLLEKINVLEKKVIEAEIYQRKSNLLFYGIKKAANENVDKVLRDTFEILGMSKADSQSISLVNAHRLPQRKADNDVPQPIIAKFVYMAQRNSVLSSYENNYSRSRRSENAPRITVRTDLPPPMKTKRNQLAKAAYKMRKEENKSTKITVEGTDVVLYWREKGTKKWEIYKG